MGTPRRARGGVALFLIGRLVARLAPATTRPTKTDEYASGNAGRLTPGMAAKSRPKDPSPSFSKSDELPTRANT